MYVIFYFVFRNILLPNQEQFLNIHEFYLPNALRYLDPRTTRVHGQITRIYGKIYWGLNYII